MKILRLLLIVITAFIVQQAKAVQFQIMNKSHSRLAYIFVRTTGQEHIFQNIAPNWSTLLTIGNDLVSIQWGVMAKNIHTDLMERMSIRNKRTPLVIDNKIYFIHMNAIIKSMRGLHSYV
jgi:hypothetical protein